MLEFNKIYLMDCFEFLQNIADESIDLAVIDPPYNIKIEEWDTFKSQEEFLEFTYKWIDEVIKKLTQNGSLYIFNTPFNSIFISQYLLNKNLKFQNWITWNKRDGFSAVKKHFTNAQETILFFTKSNEFTFNSDAVRVPYESTERMEHAQKKGILKNGKRWFPNPKGKLCSDVWHITSYRHKNKVNGKVQKLIHKTPKPLEIIERIILASSNENDIILDCFSGTGTTALVSKLLNRKFLCCDNNEEYVNLSIQRIENECGLFYN